MDERCVYIPTNCLVTGGAGFIGSHIIAKLIELGYNVTCYDSFDDYYDVSLKEENIRPFFQTPGFKLVRSSILNIKDLNRAMKGVDYVFHNAARAGVRESVRNPMKSLLANAMGTLRVLEAAHKAGVRKVIYSSSSSVYGKTQYLPISEFHPARPISPYGASKLCAENYCEIFRDIYGLDTVSLRYFTVYGPRMRPDLAISIFTRKALAGEDIDIFGNGHKSRDFTYIDDVVKANELAMSRGSGIYNIGNGESITINGLASAIIELAGSKSRVKHKADMPGDMEHTRADIARARDGLGYRPRVNIREGLRMYIDHMMGERGIKKEMAPFARVS